MFIPPEYEDEPDIYLAIQASLQDLDQPVGEWMEDNAIINNQDAIQPDISRQKTPSTGKYHIKYCQIIYQDKFKLNDHYS